MNDLEEKWWEKEKLKMELEICGIDNICLPRVSNKGKTRYMDQNDVGDFENFWNMYKLWMWEYQLAYTNIIYALDLYFR